MGNINEPVRNEPDSFDNIGTDIIMMREKSSLDMEYIHNPDNLLIYPSITNRLLNWWFSKSTDTFCFDLYDSIQNHPAESLGNEIKRMVTQMTVSVEEAQRIVSLIIDDLERALQNQNVPRIWRCYGSYHDGLCCKNSDIDLFYSLNGVRYDDGLVKGIKQLLGWEESNDGNTETIPLRMVELLRQSKLFTKVFYIHTAKIPIIKLYHLGTKKNVDITCNLTSIMNTELMKFYVIYDCNVKFLTLYIRKTLTKYGLHGTNKITTTILFWLVVYFMQQIVSLPSVFEVREMSTSPRRNNCDWDNRVPNIEMSNHLPPHLGKLSLLLLNFFKFYKEYNFSRNVICPLTGHDVTVIDFKNLRFGHSSFSVYVNKLKKNEVDGFPLSYINLQDPTILCNNLAKQTNENTLNRFKILCYYAYENLFKCIIRPGTGLTSYKEYLPTDLNLEHSDRWHNNLLQYFTLSLKFYSLSRFSIGDTACILHAIRDVMTGALSFNCDFRVPINGDRKRNDDTLWTYLEFSANITTWNNSFVRRIYRLIDIPWNVNRTKQPISVCMVCGVNESSNSITIWLQSELHMHTFLKSNFGRLLASVLKSYGITVEGFSSIFY